MSESLLVQRRRHQELIRQKQEERRKREEQKRKERLVPLVANKDDVSTSCQPTTNEADRCAQNANSTIKGNEHHLDQRDKFNERDSKKDDKRSSSSFHERDFSVVSGNNKTIPRSVWFRDDDDDDADSKRRRPRDDANCFSPSSSITMSQSPATKVSSVAKMDGLGNESGRKRKGRSSSAARALPFDSDDEIEHFLGPSKDKSNKKLQNTQKGESKPTFVFTSFADDDPCDDGDDELAKIAQELKARRLKLQAEQQQSDTSVKEKNTGAIERTELVAVASDNEDVQPTTSDDHTFNGANDRERRPSSIKDVDMWPDSDVDEVTSKPKQKLKVAAKRACKKKKKERTDDTSRLSVVYSDDEERDCFDEDRETLGTQLKPEFDAPKFGPFALEPIHLPHGNGLFNQVPASMARYLPTYQRVGIEFLHAALATGTGAVLGDEMGLGKTVQIISLVSALLGKSGTGLDLLELQRRRRIISKKEEELRIATDRALLTCSRLPIPNIRAEGLELPNWAPILLIVPPTTLQNWKNEFQAWGHFGIAEYAGAGRDVALEKIRTGKAEILLCGKSLFMQSQDFTSLNAISWKLVIIDEFHLFKNPDGSLSRNLRTMKQTHSTVRVIGMTGTLMQNDHKELWNLIDLVETGFLGSWAAFDVEVSRPIKLARAKTADEAAVVRGNKKNREFMQKLAPLYIQRVKKDVLKDHLPEKDERVLFCELSPLQKRLYQHILALPEFALLKRAHGPCDCGINQEHFIAFKKLRTRVERIDYQRKHKDHIRLMKDCCYQIPLRQNGRGGSSEIDPNAVLWRFHEPHEGGVGCKMCPFCIFFPALMKLVKLTSHAALLQIDHPLHTLTEGSPEYRSTLKDLEFAKVAIPKDELQHFPGGSYVREDSIMDNHFMLSGKMKTLDALLWRLSAKRKRILLFSFSTKTLDLIQNYVRSNGFTFLRMDGSTPMAKRAELVAEYQSNPNIFVFLLSTKAAGLGINLTAGNVVIIFDVEWNPSADAQAQDRAYRIGQTQDVQVIRLVSRGTVDELKYIRQIYKEQLKKETLGNADGTAPRADRLFRGVQGDKNRKGELFGSENLLKYKDGSFMDELWKSSSNSTVVSGSGNLALRSNRDLANALQDITDLDDIDGGQFDTFEEIASQAILANSTTTATAAKSIDAKPTATTLNDSREEDNERDTAELFADAKAFKHEDFFRGDRGGAALKPGDDGYDEEMGGESQMMNEVYEKADVDQMEAGADNDYGMEQGAGQVTSIYSADLDSVANSHGDPPPATSPPQVKEHVSRRPPSILALPVEADTSSQVTKRPTHQDFSLGPTSSGENTPDRTEEEVAVDTNVKKKISRPTKSIGVVGLLVAQTKRKTEKLTSGIHCVSYKKKKRKGS